VATGLALLCPAPGPAYANAFGPSAPRNPYMAAGWAASMHADAASSGASQWPGPGLGDYTVTVNTLGAACPTIVAGSDRMPVALCTTILGENPTVYLLDPATGAPLTSLALPDGGNLFGGVYTYIDQNNDLVLFNAYGDLLRIRHAEVDGKWELSAVSSIAAGPAIDKFCANVCGGIVGIIPDRRGNVWFATTDGVVGFVTPRGRTEAVRLRSDELVANSISSVPDGVAIATTRALYMMDVHGGVPHVIWRYAYDRGPSRRPGQLSWGTGATPVFFGPADRGTPGSRYLTITDNAAPAEHLLVFDTWARVTRHKHTRKANTKVKWRVATRPQPVCDIPVLTPGPSGTENAPVASGDSVFVASTYGYPYPASPTGEPAPEPATAPFNGGITRVDLNPDGHGCHVVWQDGIRSAAVPRLDIRDGILFTSQRTDPLDPSGTSDLDSYSLVAIDAGNGDLLDSGALGIGYESDTLQLSSTIVPGDVMYQGTITGVDRIAAAAPTTSPLAASRLK
jgi:hypothetical protein